MRKQVSAWGLAGIASLAVLALLLTGTQAEVANSLLSEQAGDQPIQQLTELHTYSVDVSGGPEQTLHCGPCGCGTPCASGGGAQQINMVLILTHTGKSLRDPKLFPPLKASSSMCAGWLRWRSHRRCKRQRRRRRLHLGFQSPERTELGMAFHS